MKNQRLSGIGSKMAYLRQPSFWILATAFTLYLMLIIPRYGKSFFHYDTFYNIWRARKISEDPLLIFRPDVIQGRFGPLYTLFFFLVDRFFGFNPWIYGLINCSLHLLNALLLFRLLRCLLTRYSEMPAIFSSIFFLFSSTHWSVIGGVHQTMRLASASLSLLSAYFFMRFLLAEKKRDLAFSWISFVLSFGFIEDAITLPLILLEILFLIPPRPIPWLKKLTVASPFFLVALMVVWLSFSAKGPQGYGLAIGPHMLVNFLSLMRDFVEFLLIPRPEYVPFPGRWGALLRLVPALLILAFVGILWYWRRDQILNSFREPFVRRILIFGMAWSMITASPYFLRPTLGWPERYVYFPGMGEAMVVGVVLYLVGKSLHRVCGDPKTPIGTHGFLRGSFVGIVIYGLVLNVSTTFVMVDNARAQVKHATQDEIPAAFSIVSALRDQYKAPSKIPPDTVLVVEGLPFSISRLRELLWIYYTSVPLMIIEAHNGRPLKDFPEASQRILYLKWENQTLSVAPVNSK